MERAGPFDEELVRNQDDEYNYRLRKMGARILLASDIRARYYSRSSLRSLWRQYLQYGYWKVRVMQKHPWQMKARHFVPLAFVCAGIALSLDRAGHRMRGVAPRRRARRIRRRDGGCSDQRAAGASGRSLVVPAACVRHSPFCRTASA